MFEKINSIAEKLVDEIVAIGVIGTVLYMTVTSIIVPEFLIVAFGAILAFYFKK